MNNEIYYTFENPVPYKSLLLYPVSMENYIMFHTVLNCLLINKNEIPDVKVISMSYLDFIFWYSAQSEENGVYIAYLVELLKLCLHVDYEDIKYEKDSNGKINLLIKDEIIDKNDFDIIKKIICEQHLIDLDEDSEMHPDVKRALLEAQAFKNKNKKKIGSLEDQLICVMISTSLNLEDIKKLSIRKFSKILERVDYKLHYTIYKSGEMSGMVSFKEGIDHWMCDLTQKDKFKEVMIDYEEYKSKFE